MKESARDSGSDVFPEEYRPERCIEELGEEFYDAVVPASFPDLRLRYRNQTWASRVGLGALQERDWQKHLAEFHALPGSLSRPLAIRYHGHQFRNYNPHLGDGRGFLFAQLRDPVDGRLLDLGTKGSGQTPYSRGGDGRLTLKGAVREALATEMLEALGVHTSKTLSFFETGEKLQRHDEPSPTRAAVLVRLSHSHVRYGCFQFQEYNQRPQQVLELLRYTCRHYFPQLVCETPERLPGLLLAEVVKRGARFAAELTVAGFVHGVLNTDNMNVTGESFDYGPYRFAPRFDPRFVAAYFDHSGLYSFGRQAEAVRWNLGHLARVLSLRCPVLCDPRGLELALKDFWPCFHQERTRLLLGRLGLIPRGDARDAELTGKVEEFLESSGVGLGQFFFDWFGGKRSQDRARRSPQGDLYRGDAFDSILGLFDEFEEEAGELLQVEYFQRERPCDLLIEEVESIWDPISKEDDWSLFEAKLRDIREMARALGNGSGASV